MDTLVMRKYVRTVIVLVILSVLTACQHDEIVGRWESDEQNGGLANMMEIQPDGKLRTVLVMRIDRVFRVEGDNLILTLTDYNVLPRPTKPPATGEKSAPDNKKLPDVKKLTDKNSGADQKATLKGSKSEKKDGKEKEDVKKDRGDKFYGEDGEPVIYAMAFNSDGGLKLRHEESKSGFDMQRVGQASTPGSVIGSWTFKHESGQTGQMVFDPDGIMHFRLPLPGGGVLTNYKVKDGTITLYNKDMKPIHSASCKLEAGKLVITDKRATTHYSRLGDL